MTEKTAQGKTGKQHYGIDPKSTGRTSISERITCSTALWRWTGADNGSWHFLTISGEAGEALTATALMRRLEGSARGFGSLRVTATIGQTSWQTSVFPSRESGWMLPVKAAVRKAERLDEGDDVDLLLEI
jgi:hypothetical protein